MIVLPKKIVVAKEPAGWTVVHPNMDIGEWLTRGTVWLALSLYVAGQVVQSVRREGSAAARWLHSVGCVAFLIHVGCAFHFYHAWSHSAAYADTARQTAQLFGWNWSGGLYVNYLFALVWVGAVVWSWANPTRHRERPKWMTWAGRSFFLFMMLNGAVVFAHGIMRWLGVALCLTLVACWWPRRKRI